MERKTELQVEIEHRFEATAGGVRLHVAAAGPADGPLVLLLHGFPEAWFGWRYQIPAFAGAGFRVLAPDQRGYNLSDKPRSLGAYRLDRLADDAAALIAGSGRESAFVAGHDWGAAVGWWTALRHPQRVRALAILNVPHPLVMRRFLLRDRTQRRRSRYMFFFQLPWLPERRLLRDGCARAVRAVQGTARPGTFSDADMERYREAWRQPGAARGMLQWYRAAFRRPPEPPEDVRVRPPTLILWGARDRFLGREMVEPSLALCRDGRAEILPEASHWIQHEEPERVNRLLLEHFRSSA